MLNIAESHVTSEAETTWPEWVENAVLVYGPRKAGTTLLQNLLDGCDELLVYPAELKLKSFTRQRHRRNDPAYYRTRSRIPTVRSSYLSSERYFDLWSSVGDLSCDLTKLIRYDAWFVHQSCSKAPRLPRMWCAKEVGGDTKRIAALWRRLFPEARFIFIMRDPLMVTRAVLNDRRRKHVRLTVWGIVRETLEPIRVLRAQEDLLSAADVFGVAYEDLVENTAVVMSRIAAMLGIPDNPVFRYPSVFGEAVVVRTSSKAAKHVFAAGSDWRDGLTRREKIIVSIVTATAALLPRYRLNYHLLRSKLSGGR